ncbi:EF-hand domain-containing protein D1 [Holothuria leucospilota]|uniref:EF-hand domain-containing protein D1 n=1 Tax=Holothuria leucospilota TaxID=206669 RepID=A0A9Q1BB31_HOLLE|nr:EF-hand domain-containing protein D1 [Holothuria leucospilota]
MDDDLANRLDKRIEAEEEGVKVKKMREYKDPREEFAHPYPEFSEFSRDQCRAFEETFASYDTDHDNFISLDEFRHMMEVRESPLTHLELKNLIQEVDEDKDGKLCFREFMLIWSKSYKKEMPEGTGYAKIVAANQKILSAPENAVKEGAKGVKGFFEAKGSEMKDQENYEEEIREQQRLKYEKKRKAKEAKEKEKQKKAKFAQRAAMFN